MKLNIKVYGEYLNQFNLSSALQPHELLVLLNIEVPFTDSVW